MNSIHLSINSIPKNDNYSNNNNKESFLTHDGGFLVNQSIIPEGPVTPLGKEGRTSPSKKGRSPASVPVGTEFVKKETVEKVNHLDSILGEKLFFNKIHARHLNKKLVDESMVDEACKSLTKKFLNQNRARKILYWHEMFLIENAQTPDGKPLYAHLTDLEKHFKASNAHSTIKCLRVKRRSADHVAVRVDNKHNTAHYGGVQQCGSPWVCHCCATKLNLRRSIEIQEAFRWAYQEMKIQVMMLTLTFPHKKLDKLSELNAKFKFALEKFRKGGNYDDYKDFVLYQGMIKRAEVTWSHRNGWHPHSHELHFIRNLSKEEQKRVFEMILNKWQAACIEAGLLSEDSIEHFRKHSVNIVFKAKASNYIAKLSDMSEEEKAEAMKKANWGADKEITSTTTKISKKFGRSPWYLLENSDNNAKYRKLWLEYALAMKGKTQLLWSRGLKGKVGIVEKKDKDILEESSSTSDVLALLNDVQWKIVLNVDKMAGKKDDRPYILWLAKNSGFDGLEQYFKAHGVILRTVIELENVIEVQNQEKISEKQAELKKQAVIIPVSEFHPEVPQTIKLSNAEIIKNYDKKYIPNTIENTNLVVINNKKQRSKPKPKSKPKPESRPQKWIEDPKNQKIRDEFNKNNGFAKIMDMHGNIIKRCDIPCLIFAKTDDFYKIRKI